MRQLRLRGRLRAAVLLCLLAGWGGAGAALGAERVLHRSGTDDPSTVDPHRVAFPGEYVIALDLFMGLTTPDPRGRPTAGCAESWVVSSDGKRYTFTLRPGLQWSDGVPLTAEDFVWSLRRAVDPATAFAFASRLFPIRHARAIATGQRRPAELGVSAPDARTVVIDLEGPTPYLLDVIALAGLPAPRHVIEKHGAGWIRPETFVGNGPFVLERWSPNSFMRLRRNPRFFDAPKVQLDAVVHYPGDNAVTNVRRYQAGELDFVMVVPPERQQWAREQFGTALKLGRGIANEVVVFNTSRGATADARVRRALSLAIERPQIARSVVGMAGVEAWSYVPPGVLNYPQSARLDFAAWPEARRLAAARTLLDEAGYGPQRPLRLRLLSPNAELNRKVAVALGAGWRRIGVQAELVQKETKSLVADVAAGDFDAARVVWLAGFSDPYAYLERMLSAGSTVGMNSARYRNPAFDALLGRAGQEVDLGRRAELLRQAEALALADQPVAPVYYLVGRRLVSPRVRGFVDNPRGLYMSWYLSVPAR